MIEDTASTKVTCFRIRVAYTETVARCCFPEFDWPRSNRGHRFFCLYSAYTHAPIKCPNPPRTFSPSVRPLK
jgi:hypothetical protein